MKLKMFLNSQANAVNVIFGIQNVHLSPAHML